MTRMQPLRIGVLGLVRGLTFARQFQALPDTQTTVVCDRDDERLRTAMVELGGGVEAVSSYDELLECDIDAVVVAGEAPDHVAQVCQALESGRHVLSEVPAGMSLESCRRLVETVRRTGLKYMLAENCWYWGYIREYQRLVESGRLGDVLYAECEYIHDVRDLCVNADGAPTWRARLNPACYLTHDLGPVLEILDDRCVSVCGLSSAPALGEGFAPAATVAIFRTAKGRVIKFLGAFGMPRPSHHWFTIMGTQGSVEAPRGTATRHLVHIEGENEAEAWSEEPWTTQRSDGPAEAMASGHGGADWFISREFADCVLNDTPSPIDVYRAMDYTVPGICAVESACNGGVPVAIPDLRV